MCSSDLFPSHDSHGMDYKKVTFRLTDTEDFMADILAAMLGDIGFESFEESS